MLDFDKHIHQTKESDTYHTSGHLSMSSWHIFSLWYRIMVADDKYTMHSSCMLDLYWQYRWQESTALSYPISWGHFMKTTDIIACLNDTRLSYAIPWGNLIMNSRDKDVLMTYAMFWGHSIMKTVDKYKDVQRTLYRWGTTVWFVLRAYLRLMIIQLQSVSCLFVPNHFDIRILIYLRCGTDCDIYIYGLMA